MATTTFGLVEKVGALLQYGAESARLFHKASGRLVGKPGRGTRRTGYEEAISIARLTLAMIGGAPTKSVESIEAFGGMTFAGGKSTSMDRGLPPNFGPMSSDDSLTFAEQLAYIIDRFCTAHAAGLGATWASFIPLEVEITTTPIKMAKITYSYESDGKTDAISIKYEGKRQHSLELEQARTPEFFYSEKKIIAGPLLDRLGLILLEARTADAARPSPTSSSGGLPTTRDENPDTLPKVSGSSSDRSSDMERQAHPHHSNGASASPSMPCVRKLVIPASSDGRAFLQPSRPNGGHDDKSYHARPTHAAVGARI